MKMFAEPTIDVDERAGLIRKDLNSNPIAELVDRHYGAQQNSKNMVLWFGLNLGLALLSLAGSFAPYHPIQKLTQDSEKCFLGGNCLTTKILLLVGSISGLFLLLFNGLRLYWTKELPHGMARAIKRRKKAQDSRIRFRQQVYKKRVSCKNINCDSCAPVWFVVGTILKQLSALLPAGAIGVLTFYNYTLTLPFRILTTIASVLAIYGATILPLSHLFDSVWSAISGICTFLRTNIVTGPLLNCCFRDNMWKYYQSGWWLLQRVKENTELAQDKMSCICLCKKTHTHPTSITTLNQEQDNFQCPHTLSLSSGWYSWLLQGALKIVSLLTALIPLFCLLTNSFKQFYTLENQNLTYTILSILALIPLALAVPLYVGAKIGAQIFDGVASICRPRHFGLLAMVLFLTLSFGLAPAIFSAIATYLAIPGIFTNGLASWSVLTPYFPICAAISVGFYTLQNLYDTFRWGSNLVLKHLCCGTHRAKELAKTHSSKESLHEEIDQMTRKEIVKFGQDHQEAIRGSLSHDPRQSYDSSSALTSNNQCTKLIGLKKPEAIAMHRSKRTCFALCGFSVFCKPECPKLGDIRDYSASVDEDKDDYVPSVW